MVPGPDPDLNTLEMDAKLEEADRGRVVLGQTSIVRIDALPELTIPAKVSQVSALAELSTEYPFNRSFRASAAILKPDKKLRPEMNGAWTSSSAGFQTPSASRRRPCFKRAGKPIVYLAEQWPLSRRRGGVAGEESR